MDGIKSPSGLCQVDMAPSKTKTALERTHSSPPASYLPGNSQFRTMFLKLQTHLLSFWIFLTPPPSDSFLNFRISCKPSPFQVCRNLPFLFTVLVIRLKYPEFSRLHYLCLDDDDDDMTVMIILPASLPFLLVCVLWLIE